MKYVVIGAGGTGGAIGGFLTRAGKDVTLIARGWHLAAALQKFSFVSPMAAQGACYDVQAVASQSEGEMRDIFVALVKEVKALSDAMGIALPDDIVEINLKIMDDLAPGTSASMYRDIKAGKQSEVDGLVYEVVRLGQKYGVDVPTYERIAAQLHARLD